MKGFRFGSTEGAFYILPGQDGWEASYGNDKLGEFPARNKRLTTSRAV